MSKTTQKKKIVAFCKAHGSITVRDAYDKLDINSPTKRISELRHSPNYVVETVEESRVNSDGDTVKYNRYFIKEAAANG